MTDRQGRLEEAKPRAQDLAPEADNSEQDRDADDQAQTVAGEALVHGTEQGLGDSEKVSFGGDFDDVPDLIDRMKQMESSGVIDMDAYRGEPNHDDDEDKLGPAGKVDKNLPGDGS